MTASGEKEILLDVPTCVVALKDDIKWNPVHMDTKETCRSVHIKRALKKKSSRTNV